ncbi:hypothetical protein ABEO75_20240 [Paenibacillus macerans]|uniref:hypothetical protein n=1 Tax=Paenibacillus macerans TaxID=44252 RepID=UPI0012D95C40|nr:hypothetical protein [Paenibacillus macerans]MED4957636.1 hypothetical protein [Paenibacillus macerans]
MFDVAEMGRGAGGEGRVEWDEWSGMSGVGRVEWDKRRGKGEVGQAVGWFH